MKLSTSQDIAAPIEHVFAAATNFEALEKYGLSYGASVERSDPNPGAGASVGTQWRIAVNYRGKERRVRIRMDQIDAPTGYRTISTSNGLEVEFIVELQETGEKTTRANVSLEARGETLAGRLLLQSLKLARGNLKRRFSDRIAKFGKWIEDSYSAQG